MSEKLSILGPFETNDLSALKLLAPTILASISFSALAAQKAVDKKTALCDCCLSDIFGRNSLNF
jgi:hypothetical protein